MPYCAPSAPCAPDIRIGLDGSYITHGNYAYYISFIQPWVFWV